jgi:hypothetical protein
MQGKQISGCSNPSLLWKKLNTRYLTVSLICINGYDDIKGLII